MSSDAPVAAAVIRGDFVESRHRAHIVVADAAGHVFASVGDPGLVTFTRSSIKAYQLAPLISSGAADRFGFSEREIAVMCSSHSAESMHTNLIVGILERIGLSVQDLKCGADAPLDPAVARALPSPPSALHHNCSGKHSNLLAQAVALGADPKTYLDREHPVQVRIRDLVARVSGIPVDQMPMATDGCSAPNFALPIAAGARLFATLADPSSLGGKDAEALSRISSAMRRHPELVGGSNNRIDTILMRAAGLRLACKIGGEAVFGVADTVTGLGLYMKIEDGSTRPIPPIVVAALESLGWLEAAQLRALANERSVPLLNARGTLVGRIESRLEWDVRRALAAKASRKA